MRMMSTISDEQALYEVLTKTIQGPVIEKMLQMDAIRRLAFMGEAVNQSAKQHHRCRIRRTCLQHSH